MLHSLLAYIGPGADLALLSSAIGLLVTLGTSMLFIVLMPFRMLMRRFRKPADVTENAAPQEERRMAA